MARIARLCRCGTRRIRLSTEAYASMCFPNRHDCRGRECQRHIHEIHWPKENLGRRMMTMERHPSHRGEESRNFASRPPLSLQPRFRSAWCHSSSIGGPEHRDMCGGIPFQIVGKRFPAWQLYRWIPRCSITVSAEIAKLRVLLQHARRGPNIAVWEDSYLPETMESGSGLRGRVGMEFFAAKFSWADQPLGCAAGRCPGVKFSTHVWSTNKVQRTREWCSLLALAAAASAASVKVERNMEHYP